MPADRVVKVPDGIDDKTAAAMMLKGMTARYLLRQTYKVVPGTVDAVARGGRRRRPDRLPVGPPPRRHGHRHGRLGRQGGARQGAWLPPRDQHQDRGLREAGQGDHRRPGLRCGLRLDRQGHLSGLARLPEAVRPVGVVRQRLGPDHRTSTSACWRAKGSLYATRPTLNTYTAKRADLVENANDLFDVVKKGAVKITINQTYAAEGRRAGAPRISKPARPRGRRCSRSDGGRGSTRSALAAASPIGEIATIEPRDDGAESSG